jgi:uncharacterized membrane protein YheB (UPF0754 family)
LIPPIAGAIIGYFTNDIAISMLFRPYQAKFIGKYQVPFTPGLIPANQARLAQRISDTIMGSLLTPGELHKLAQRLLQTERVEAGITWLLQLTLKQIKEDRQQKTNSIVSNILKDLFSDSLPRLLKALARREDFLEDQINQIFDKILLEFQLNDLQAKQIADWLLDNLLPPEVLRISIINFLSDRNIQVIDDILREKTTGTYWMVANLLGIKSALYSLRSFCLDEQEIANTRLQEIILSLEVRLKIRNWLKQRTLGSLPQDTILQLRKNTQEVIRAYLQDKGNSILQKLGSTIDWDRTANLLINRLQSSAAVSGSLSTISHELALLLEKYLEADLEKIVQQAIPILSIDQVIIARVNSTSPEDLESAIQGIVKSELQAIVNLGGILGFVVGILQTVLMVFTNNV